MTPFFSSEARKAAFIADAKSWEGTPFVPGACVRGGGVDCVNLGRALYEARGLILPPFPKYQMDEGKHLKMSKLKEYIEGTGRFVRIGGRAEIALANTGDTLCFKFIGVPHHTGFMLGRRQFVHCLFGRAISIGDLADGRFKILLTDIFRPMATAQYFAGGYVGAEKFAGTVHHGEVRS